MAPEYLSPGVYVEEVDRGSKPIEGAGTSVAAFVGFAEKGPINEPTFIPNWTEFVTKFGGFIKGFYLAAAVFGYFQNGGGRCFVTRLPGMGDTGEGTPAKSAAALPSHNQPSIEGLVVTALEAGEAGAGINVEISKPSGEGIGEDLFNMTISRGETREVFENLTLKRGKNVRNVLEVVNKESRLINVAEKESTLSLMEKTPQPGKYPLAAAPTTTALAKVSSDVLVGQAAQRSGVAGLEVAEEVTMVCCPDLMALYQAGAIDMDGVKAVQLGMIAHCETMKDRFAILDCPPGLSPQQVKDWRMKEAGYDTKYGAVYYPWIKIANPAGGGGTIMVPPCGHLAGIYARSDTERGVHKAPANEVIRGVMAVETQITKSEQDILNPVGVNCIRAFPGRGIRVWGARTLSSDASWRYINVRRLFNFVEESIQQGTQWIVFEPNDPALWARIRRDISAFLTTVWRSGALFGLTPAEAFFVKCDAENNPPSGRDLGQVVIEIGIAPVKPAEFVIFRISQWTGGGNVAE